MTLGLCLALINWHRIKREPKENPQSRGRIIPQLIGHPDGRAIDRELRRMELSRLRPFRLIAIEAERQVVTEWRWDAADLSARKHRWQICHWFSSGYDEAQAERQRTKICATLSLGKVGSLRDLHASHLPRRGPFSICMHRADAMTVSYSEVNLSVGAHDAALFLRTAVPRRASDGQVASAPL